jgi:hypothetical protein
MQEETLLMTKLAMQNQMLATEKELDFLQSGVSSGIYYGKSYSGTSYSIQEEIR